MKTKSLIHVKVLDCNDEKYLRKVKKYIKKCIDVDGILVTNERVVIDTYHIEIGSDIEVSS